MLARLRTVVLLTLVACGADDDDFEDLDQLDELNELAGGKADGATWEGIGNGVAYQRVNAGHGILIAYGGYTARLVHSASWGTELVDARLGAEGIGHIYAVKGPAQASYAAREIGNSKLRAHLATLADAPADPGLPPDDLTDPATAPIIVVAHSSGSFVAHELLQQLQARDDGATLARIAYANLDGGGSGLSKTIAQRLGHLSFVYAKDPTLARGMSQNSSTAIALGMAYAPHGSTFEVNIQDTGCNSGAGWCLHDVVITHRPHNPNMFDVARDYSDFEGRPVTTEYLEPFFTD